MTILLLVIFINKILKIYYNYKRKNRAITYWTPINLKVIKIKATWTSIWMQFEYILQVEDKNQVYTSPSFYAKNIDEYVRIWDYVTLYTIKWERLNYYIDLDSITPWHSVWNKTTNETIIDADSETCDDKITEKAEKDPFWESFSTIIVCLFLILVWVLFFFAQPIIWIFLIVIGCLGISNRKKSWNMHECINTWEKIKWVLESIEECKSILWWMTYVVNVKANWKIYKSNKLYLKPKFKIWDTIYVYVVRHNPEKYFVDIKEDINKYSQDMWKSLEEKIKYSPASFYNSPVNVLKKTYNEVQWIEQPSEKTVKKDTLEDKYPYLALNPKKRNIIWILIGNRKNSLVWFVTILIGCLSIYLWEISGLIMLWLWLLVVYPIIYKLYEFYIQNKLTKIWIKTLTTISKIEFKKEIFVSENNNGKNNGKNDSKYSFVIYTTDGENEYKSFKVKCPMVKEWDPLYVYISPENKKSYRVDTSNIWFDIVEFIQKILWRVFPWMIKN